MTAACERPRAIAYVRLAEAKPDLSEQRDIIEAWAERENVAIASWRSDVGIEGSTPIAERPGLVAAYRDIRAHGAKVLVAAQADRFGFQELVCWLIERAALEEGAVLRTADGSRIPTRGTPSAEEPGQAHTRGAIDLARAYERVMFQRRVRAALAEKRARGERVGNVPYGYRLASDGVHIEPDAREQSVIANVHRLSREGLSQRAIVASLAEHGVVGRTGAPLRQTQVAKILRSTG